MSLGVPPASDRKPIDGERSVDHPLERVLLENTATCSLAERPSELVIRQDAPDDAMSVPAVIEATYRSAAERREVRVAELLKRANMKAVAG